MSRANPRFRRNNPPLPAPPANIFQVAALGTVEGQMTVNTFYYWDSGEALTALSESALEAAWVGTYQTPYVACMSSDWALTGYRVSCVTTPTRAPLIASVNAAGTGPAGHEPTEIAAVVLRRTLFRGQCGRGRFSLPAVPTSWVTNSRITTFTAYNAFLTATAANLTSGAHTWIPYLVSHGPRTGRALGAAQLVSQQIMSLLGTIRRRKIGRGK
jgi:hypothetical protein